MTVHIKEYTKKELAEAIRFAKKNNCPISIPDRNSEFQSVLIGKLPVGCGYGDVCVSIPKSHRKSDKMLQIQGCRCQGSNWHYTRFYYTIPNTTEAIEEAKKIGASVVSKPGAFMGSLNQDIRVMFIGVNKK